MTTLGNETTPQPIDTLVETPQGNLLGETAGPDNAIRVFKGIPYASPPVGNRRWAPPEPMLNWAGTRLAKAYSPMAMQATMPASFGVPLGQSSEDCLYLNVWTPVPETVTQDSEPATKRPVMVWIHGGAKRWGSGELNGVALAQKGVVLVSMNYRHGLFGYFAHPELSAESPHNSSGNYAILDQIQALKWVQDNISAFGGDPDNVTLFGCSAGAASIHGLVVSPLARGLFHKAIPQSGSLYFPCRGLSSPLLGAQTGEELGVEFAQSAGAKSLAELRNLPADQLVQVADTADNGDFYLKSGEIIDGWVLPDQPLHISRRGEQNPVSILSGYTANDGNVIALLGYAASIPASAEVYETEIRKRYGDLAEPFLALYPASDMDESYYGAMRDRAFGWASESWVQHAHKVGAPAYLYYFAHIPPNGYVQTPIPGSDRQRQEGAAHGADVVYALNDPMDHPQSAQYPPTEKDFAMAETISDYWVAFATTGKPEVSGLPPWQAYTDKARQYIRFEDGAAHPGKDLFPGMWELVDEDVNRRLTLPGVGREYYAVGISSPVLPTGSR